MKGIIIKPKWAELILNGEKNIEVRSRKVNIRGKIGIIKSGSKKVYGTVELVECKKIDSCSFELWRDRHKLNMTYEELLNIYPEPYAWFLKDPKRIKPYEYKHKKGCVIWVNIEGDKWCSEDS